MILLLRQFLLDGRPVDDRIDSKTKTDANTHALTIASRRPYAQPQNMPDKKFPHYWNYSKYQKLFRAIECRHRPTPLFNQQIGPAAPEHEASAKTYAWQPLVALHLPARLHDHDVVVSASNFCFCGAVSLKCSLGCKYIRNVNICSNIFEREKKEFQ